MVKRQWSASAAVEETLEVIALDQCRPLSSPVQVDYIALCNVHDCAGNDARLTGLIVREGSFSRLAIASSAQTRDVSSRPNALRCRTVVVTESVYQQLGQAQRCSKGRVMLLLPPGLLWCAQTELWCRARKDDPEAKMQMRMRMRLRLLTGRWRGRC